MSLGRFAGGAALVLAVLAGTVGSTRADTRAVATLAHIKLSGVLDEAPVSEDPLFGTSTENFQSKLDRIHKAKDDSNIQGLFLEINDLRVSYGKLNELRRAVADFRKSGKKTYAYMESGESKDYLLACACDEVCLPEAGWLMVVGIRAEVTFFKDLLDKVGVQADMLQMGTYKGAAEPFTRSSMSKPFRERLESVIDDMYENDLVGTIVQSRSGKKAPEELTAEHVKKLIDQGPFSARAAQEAGLIDRVAYREEFQDSLKSELHARQVKVDKNYGHAEAEEIDFSNPFSALLKLFKPPEVKSSKKDKIAVIYASGVIVTGKSGDSFLSSESTVGSTTMVEAIRQAEKDKTVKAIVLRVDSPGGSALASDLIWYELTRSKKPVVASMSDVAASGGYYISMAARKIYAEPGTLTGSIGVVGGKLVLGGLYDKIGVKTDIISRGANAGILSSTTPFSDSQRAAMKGLMQDMYNQFLDKAIQGRQRAGKKFTRAEFSQFAEGRIWTGRQAKIHGLVDELGTLDDAIAAAKQMAGIAKEADIERLVLPKPKTFFEQLFESRSDTGMPPLKVRELPVLGTLPELSNHLKPLEGLLHLRGEPVWAILPYQVEVR
ncbi:MAG: signal peptide peptidase SppA [Planctomycetes bacterium]|nr:signal peptide peptidase SppA [Planctomycetota bacterium]